MTADRLESSDIRLLVKMEVVRAWVLALLFFVAFLIIAFEELPVRSLPAGDELQYSFMSRVFPFSRDWIPNYLYYTVFSVTNACDDRFYECAKLLNIMFFLGCSVIVLMIARLAVGWGLAVVTAVLFILSPWRIYSSLFMPEISYGLCAWAILYYLVYRSPAWHFYDTCIAGVAIGLAMLVKAHGIFFLLVCSVYFLAYSYSVKLLPWRANLLNIVLLVFAALSVRFILGLLLAGPSSLSLMGTAYSSMAQRSTLFGYIRLGVQAAVPYMRHLCVLALLLGTPICAILGDVIVSWRNGMTTGVRKASFALFLISFFLIMPAVVAAFTSLATLSPGQTLDRIHMRYYDFLIFAPIVYCLFHVTDKQPRPARTVAIAIGAIVGLVAVFGVVYLPTAVVQSAIDAPELHGVLAFIGKFYAFSIVSICCIVIWIFNQRAAVILFLVVQVPYGTLISNQILNRDLRGAIDFFNDYGRSGAIAHSIWGDKVGNVFVAGHGVGEGFHTLFEVDRFGALIELSEGERLSKAQVPPGTRSGVIVGQHEPEFPYSVVYQEKGFKLIEMGASPPGTP